MNSISKRLAAIASVRKNDQTSQSRDYDRLVQQKQLAKKAKS